MPEDIKTTEDPEICVGQKTKGGSCGRTVDHESGYCKYHMTQWVFYEQYLASLF